MFTKKTSSLFPPRPGTYTLILRVSEPVDVAVGALGVRHFPRGLYSYTGSALGRNQNLRTRVMRHLTGAKKLRWHIDYLLEHARVVAVAYYADNRRLECPTVQVLSREEDSAVVVPGFGSSDCSQGCPAHLYHHPNLNVEKLALLVSLAYRELGCEATLLRV